MRAAAAAAAHRVEHAAEVLPAHEEVAVVLPELPQRTRQLVAHAALPASVTLYSVVGVGQDTWMGLNFTGIEALDDLQTAKYSMVSHDGDGTVPTESASQPLMPVRAERRVKADHMAILMHRDTLSFLLDALYGRA